jgi:hypothetical protein
MLGGGGEENPYWVDGGYRRRSCPGCGICVCEASKEAKYVPHVDGGGGKCCPVPLEGNCHCFWSVTSADAVARSTGVSPFRTCFVAARCQCGATSRSTSLSNSLERFMGELRALTF